MRTPIDPTPVAVEEERCTSDGHTTASLLPDDEPYRRHAQAVSTCGAGGSGWLGRTSIPNTDSSTVRRERGGSFGIHTDSSGPCVPKIYTEFEQTALPTNDDRYETPADRASDAHLLVAERAFGERGGRPERSATTVSENARPDGEWEDVDDVSWTLLNVDGIARAYRKTVHPILRADGLDPERDRPTHEWLRERDLRPMLYALREYHDRTFVEFWEGDLGYGETESDRTRTADAGGSHDWATDDRRTVEALESFLTSRRDRKGLAESSIRTLRYRLDRYVRAYSEANGTDDLVTPVARGSDAPAYEAVDACWAAFDRLHADLDAGTTKRRVHLAVSNWYAHLVRRKRAALNPADGLDDEFDWSTADADDADTPCLSNAHVRALHRAAETAEERLLVLALCAWGLRPGEVARLHARQFVLDPSDDEVPYVEFEERKNGPGQVSLLYGLDELEERLGAVSAVDSDAGGGDGYLFLSPHASRDHVSRWTVWNRFGSLADRAGLPEEIDGVAPSPKMGRRFWYDAYASSLDVVLESLDEIAAEQGSSSADVVLRNYLSDARARQLRREYMRDRLADAFE